MIKEPEVAELIGEGTQSKTAPDPAESTGAAENRNPEQAKALWPLWLRIVAVSGILVLLAAPLVLLHEQLFSLFEERERILTGVREAGAWGPLVIVGLAIAQTIVAPIPGQVVNFASSYIYGLWPGMLYSWIGLVLGTSIAMGLARYAGRPLVERIIGPKSLQAVDRAAAGRGLGFFFLFFLIPGLPDDILCFVAGLTSLPLRILIPIASIARIPGLVGSAWLGANAHSLPLAAWALLGIAGIGATYAMWRYGEQMQDRMMQWLNSR